MGNCHDPSDNAPVTPARQPFGTAVTGGPTAVIDVAGTRLGTDPGPGPPGDYRFTRDTTGPAVPASVLANRHQPAQPRPSPKFHGTRDFLRRAWQNGCSKNSPDRK